MGKVRVLHIIKTLNLGGAETNLYNLVKAIDPEKFEVHVAYSFGGEIEGRFRDGGVKLFKYADGDHKIKSFVTFVIIFRLINYILTNKIQIVHTHIFNAQIWGGIAAKITGRKIVEHVHDFRYLGIDEVKRRRGITNQYQYIKYFRNFSDAVVVLTKQNCDFLIQNKLYSPDRVYQIYNGIPVLVDAAPDERTRLLLKAEFGLKNASSVIFIASRFVGPKNLDLITRIAPSVVKDIPDAVFVIAGDGILLDEFKSKCRELKLDSVIKVIGFQADIYKILSFSDIFLLPSFLELHSIAILEAMSRKVPVVTSKDVGCNNEFINDWENGVLLDPFIDKGWSEAIIRLLRDTPLRMRIGQKGYETCRDIFDIKHAARKIEGLYAELLDK